VAFEWRRPHRRDGFDLAEKTVEGASAAELVLLHHGRHSFDGYQPLADETGLFRIFADTDPTPEGSLDFANHYGLLCFRRCVRDEPQVNTATIDPWLTPGPMPHGTATIFYERVAAWLILIQQFNFLVRLWDAAREGDHEKLDRLFKWSKQEQAFVFQDHDGRERVVHPDPGRLVPKNGQLVPRVYDPPPLFPTLTAGEWHAWHFGEQMPGARLDDTPRAERALSFCWHALHAGFGLAFGHGVGNDRVGYTFETDLRLKLSWNAAARGGEVHAVPKNLFAALCLQFALALAGDKNYQRCASCGKWFELLPGVNRADRQTCSQTCRTRLYRQRKERALALHAQGQTARAIARELDANLDAVTKWIAGGAAR
jgi:hypothetical protein